MMTFVMKAAENGSICEICKLIFIHSQFSISPVDYICKIHTILVLVQKLFKFPSGDLANTPPPLKTFPQLTVLN